VQDNVFAGGNIFRLLSNQWVKLSIYVIAVDSSSAWTKSEYRQSQGIW